MWGAPVGLCPPSIAQLRELPPPQHVPAFVPAPANSYAARPLPGGWRPLPCVQLFSPTKSFLHQISGLTAAGMGVARAV